MNNTALVTGGSQRIGKAICEKIAEKGWNVAIHFNKSSNKVISLKKKLEKFGVKCVSIKADLSKENEIKNLFSEAQRKIGKINCLINNASTFELDSIDTIKKKDWDYHLNVNVWAPIFLIKQLKKNLPKNVDGNIINIIDQRVLNLTPFFTTYTFTKSGLWILTKTLAMALAPRIRVNAVGPGPTLSSKRQSEKQFKKQWKSMPLKKKIDPTEIADAVLFILQSKSLTGQIIPVDAGQHLGWAQSNNQKILYE